jgi:AcrR family transcriptional regulator
VRGAGLALLFAAAVGAQSAVPQLSIVAPAETDYVSGTILIVAHIASGTPTSMISRVAGVSAGTLFLYFPTKNDLINSVYFEAKECMGRAACEGYELEKGIRNRVKHIWGNIIRWGVDHPEEFMFIEQFHSSPFISDITQEESVKNFEFLFDVLNDGVRRGELKTMDRHLALAMLYSANAAVIRSIIRQGTVKDVDDVIDRSFDIVWSGIALKSSTGR